MMTAPPNKSEPSCNENEEIGGEREERRGALDRGGKKKRSKKQTPVADKAVCLTNKRKSSPG